MNWQRKLQPVEVPPKFRNGPFDSSFEVCGRTVMDVLDGGYAGDGEIRERTLAIFTDSSAKETSLNEEALERVWNGEEILRKLAREALQSEFNEARQEAEEEGEEPPEDLTDLSWQARDSAIRMGYLGLLKREGFTKSAFDKLYDTSSGGDYNERIWQTMDEVYGKYNYLHHEQENN